MGKPDIAHSEIARYVQNLVEADVYYGAINENSKTRIYRPEMLAAYPDVTEALAGETDGELLRIVTSMM